MDNVKKNVSLKVERSRKFLLFIPVLVFPFMTLMLWALGIIRTPDASGKEKAEIGFNLNLPNPKLGGDSNWNKLKFYEKADKDSARYKSLMKSDPLYQLTAEKEQSLFDTGYLIPDYNAVSSIRKPLYDPYPYELKGRKDPNEEKVYRKLDELNKELRKTEALDVGEPFNASVRSSATTGINSPEIDRLESMMQQMQSGENGDPEMERINGMLEKILDIQHPDRIKHKLKTEKEMEQKGVFAVSANTNPDNISFFGNSLSEEIRVTNDSLPYGNSWGNGTGFYSISDKRAISDEQNAIRAVIPEAQILITGSTIKLRLVDAIHVNGIIIPKGQFVFGTAALDGERLTIEINSIRYKNNVLPVSLAVYDTDGMRGIYMPGTITRDVAKQSTDQAIQSIGIASLDPSLGAQAATAGITAAKSLLSKKAKLVKVTVKSGYEIFLKDNKQAN